MAAEVIAEFYTVHAYRWGERERHSYPVYAGTDGMEARHAASEEEQHRGGKYECEIIRWHVGEVASPESWRTIRTILKPLSTEAKYATDW